MIAESCFQRFYWGNRYADSEYDIINNIWYLFCCLRLRSKQISELC